MQLENLVVISLVLFPMIANSKDCAEIPLQSSQPKVQEFLVARPLSFLSRVDMMLLNLIFVAQVQVTKCAMNVIWPTTLLLSAT